MKGYSAEKAIATVICVSVAMILFGGAGFQYGLVPMEAGYGLIVAGLVLLALTLIVATFLAKGWAPGFRQRSHLVAKIQYRFIVDRDGVEHLTTDGSEPLSAKAMVKVAFPDGAQAEFVVGRDLYETLYEGASYEISVLGSRLLEAKLISPP